MKKKILMILAAVGALALIAGCENYTKETPNIPGKPQNPVEPESVPMKLWYTEPAADWMVSALPIGNGSLGGMFFGGIQKEEIQFNEKTLWTGSTTVRGAYQNFGSVIINFPHSPESVISDYRRELSLDTAIGSVSYKADGVSYLREYFASFPDKVIVMRFSTPDEKGNLNMTVSLAGAHREAGTIEGNSISFKGKLDLLSYEARLTVLNEEGRIEATESGFKISDADTVTILLIGGTNYAIESPTYIGETEEGLHGRMSETIDSASAKSYTVLKQNHLNDYRPLFSRVKLDLNAQMPDIPTNEMLISYKGSPYLDTLYFQYGRYLMIGSSRGSNLPNNLQGIWNNSNSPKWECDIHTNINIQMNYWPAEVTNLSECHLPFLNYIEIEALRPGGSFQKQAASLGNPGWTLKTQSNIFAFTDWNWNRPANAWYCMHLWQHYAYTNDLDFLRGKAFPVMKSACEFWLARLKLNTTDSKWEAPDEWSPEHGPWENGVSYAQQLIWELFDKTIKAASILGINDSFVSTVQDRFNNLDNGLAIGSWGQIREWKQDRSNLESNSNDTHRHVSHLVALYPGDQISYLADPQYADAAKVSLNARGDEGTGWSMAWKISLWARLFDGERAYTLLKQELNRSADTASGGGVYDNLLCSHPPFQIDGNFGTTVGIAEMLLQSNRGFIHLLPALPSAWSSGSVQGLRAQGDFTVNLTWANSRPVSCSVYSGSGNDCTIYYSGMDKKTFSTTPGSTYTINF